MNLPAASKPLVCPRCDSTQVRLEPARGTGTSRAACSCGHRFAHPDQAFARDLQRGRERIDLGPAR